MSAEGADWLLRSHGAESLVRSGWVALTGVKEMVSIWRRGWDPNPRRACTLDGLQVGRNLTDRIQQDLAGTRTTPAHASRRRASSGRSAPARAPAMRRDPTLRLLPPYPRGRRNRMPTTRGDRTASEVDAEGTPVCQESDTGSPGWSARSGPSLVGGSRERPKRLGNHAGVNSVTTPRSGIPRIGASVSMMNDSWMHSPHRADMRRPRP